MTQPDKETIKHIKFKGYSTEDDNKLIWKVHDELFGKFEGSYGCQECIREAVNKIINHIESNEI